MIRESLIDSNLNKLSATFGARLVVRPPASAEEVAKLEHLVGPLPREFAIFLLTCNGLRIRDDDLKSAGEGHLWHTDEIIASIVDPQGFGTVPSLLPFCGDPTTVRDCLVTRHGPVEGGVVRWDPWSPDVELLASGFGMYFSRWTDYVIERYEGKRDAGLDSPMFDATYIGVKDTRCASLRCQPCVIDHLNELDHMVASGDDFE